MYLYATYICIHQLKMKIYIKLDNLINIITKFISLHAFSHVTSRDEDDVFHNRRKIRGRMSTRIQRRLFSCYYRFLARFGPVAQRKRCIEERDASSRSLQVALALVKADVRARDLQLRRNGAGDWSWAKYLCTSRSTARTLLLQRTPSLCYSPSLTCSAWRIRRSSNHWMFSIPSLCGPLAISHYKRRKRRWTEICLS